MQSYSILELNLISSYRTEFDYFNMSDKLKTLTCLFHVVNTNIIQINSAQKNNTHIDHKV